jgi:ABC-type branched-subunit amino acid transport system substrate-binding protein
MGTPLVSYPQVQTILAHVPIVSPSGSVNPNNGQSNIFYVAPPIAQEGIDAANYVEQKWQHIAILSNPCDAYGKTQADAFRKTVQSYDQSTNTNILQADLPYGCTQGHDIHSVARSAMSLSPAPDLLYVAGSASDADAVLSERRIAQKSVAIMGGDALYKIGGYTNGNFQDFYFTAFAYPDEWTAQSLPQHKFFYEYPDDFDGWPPHGTYRFSRPDSDAILAYDAASILLAGNDRTHGGNIMDGLRTISGSNAFQGFSGRISFASNGTPAEKAIVMLYVKNGYITYQTILGRFQ